ncbi:MAG TPA: hypothetical protein VGE91_01555 [Solirubrobacterales bacterium]
MALDALAVSALGLAASGGDDLESVRARLEARATFGATRITSHCLISMISSSSLTRPDPLMTA